MKTVCRLAGIAFAVLALTLGGPRVSAADMGVTAEKIAIQELFARYVYALDTLDPKAYSALFTPDAVIALVGKEYRGTAEIEKLVQGFRDQIDFTKIKADSHGRKFDYVRHVNTSFIINVTGNTATSESYFVEVKSNAETHQPPSVVNMGRYEDTLVKQNGEWLFKKRDIIVDIFRAPSGTN
jgi:uncharacterized protein (TIGR02246 family)